jgi:hypothetical protein
MMGLEERYAILFDGDYVKNTLKNRTGKYPLADEIFSETHAPSDLVPAMKLARREGLRVLLDTLGNQGVRPELKIHSDRMLG